MARREEEESKFMFFVGNIKQTGNLEDLGVDGRMILKWVLKN